MAYGDDTAPVDPSGRRDEAGPPPLAAPRFDARSVQRARAAVPLENGSRWGGRLPWIVVALVAGMIGGLLGIWALGYYQGERRVAQTAAAPPASSPANAPPTPRDAGATEQTENGTQDGAQEAATPDEAAEGAADEPAGASPASADDEGQLRNALAAWIGATNARDLEGQMSFYDSRLSTFYLARGATRAAVRAEKAAVFSRASRVDVRADPPQIFLSRDGRTATMRFRKQFAIEGGGVERRGAVLQELRWRRTPAGWKIVGERDLRVID